MKNTTLLIIIGFVIFNSCQTSEGVKTNLANTELSESKKRGDYRIMFYNAENLFDTYNDSLKRDDEFLPDGAKYWSFRKYRKKLSNIAKVITAIGGWEPPEIVGLCEIENRYVLDGLVRFSPLAKLKYKIIHKESPDKRGIDVALLYLKDKFKPIKYVAIPIVFPDPSKKTRDILYVKGKTIYNDTLHIFVNHWPSRWGGQLESEDRRILVASVLRKNIDSLLKSDINPKIIIMGDLNDYPTNKSLIETLNAKIKYDKIKNEELYNLAYYMQENKGLGTHKHAGEWGVLDQIIISGSLLNKNMKIHTTIDDAHVFEAKFLLEVDENNVGFRPFRTYIGFRFHDGYSDHLPVYIDLFKSNKQEQ